jgi:hypothetical protein
MSTMEIRLKRTKAGITGMMNRKSTSTEATIGAPTCARVRVFRGSMGQSVLMLSILGLLSKTATLEMGLPEKTDSFVGLGLQESGAAARIHPSVMDSSYNAIQDFFELMSKKGD